MLYCPYTFIQTHTHTCACMLYIAWLNWGSRRNNKKLLTSMPEWTTSGPHNQIQHLQTNTHTTKFNENIVFLCNRRFVNIIKSFIEKGNINYMKRKYLDVPISFRLKTDCKNVWRESISPNILKRKFRN